MSLTLEIITPDEKVLSTEAIQVVLPTESGEAGILTGHIPMVTKVVAGELKVIRDGITEFIAVDHGFAKVSFWAIAAPIPVAPPVSATRI